MILCGGVRYHFNECPRYEIKQSVGDAPALEHWGMRNTPSLPLLLGLLCPGVVVLSMGKIELFAN